MSSSRHVMYLVSSQGQDDGGRALQTCDSELVHKDELQEDREPVGLGLLLVPPSARYGCLATAWDLNTSKYD